MVHFPAVETRVDSCQGFEIACGMSLLRNFDEIRFGVAEGIELQELCCQLDPQSDPREIQQALVGHVGFEKHQVRESLNSAIPVSLQIFQMLDWIRFQEVQEQIDSLFK